MYSDEYPGCIYYLFLEDLRLSDCQCVTDPASFGFIVAYYTTITEYIQLVVQVYGI